MTRKESVGDIAAVGDFAWIKDDQKRRSLVVALPLGKSWSVCSWTIDHRNHCNAQWSWDGNKDEPTLKPSLHWVGAWHGWVRKGMLVEA
jgi:Family of unknown function (DUF6527)